MYLSLFKVQAYMRTMPENEWFLIPNSEKRIKIRIRIRIIHFIGAKIRVCICMHHSCCHHSYSNQIDRKISVVIWTTYYKQINTLKCGDVLTCSKWKQLVEERKIFGLSTHCIVNACLSELYSFNGSGWPVIHKSWVWITLQAIC